MGGLLPCHINHLVCLLLAPGMLHFSGPSPQNEVLSSRWVLDKWRSGCGMYVVRFELLHERRYGTPLIELRPARMV
jgi:hypothetical protein